MLNKGGASDRVPLSQLQPLSHWLAPRAVKHYNWSVLAEVDEKLRNSSSAFLYLLEATFYIAVGLFLSVAALGELVGAAAILWRGVAGGTLAGYGLQVLDQLLIVLVLVEILHTVRISIRSKEIIIEPFLIVGLIASIRRVLVITMQAAKLTEQTQNSTAATLTFQNSMVELGLLGFLVLMFVISIHLLRRGGHTHLVKE